MVKRYDSEPTDVPYSPNQFLGLDFFAVSYSKTALDTIADYFDFEFILGLSFKAVFVDNLHCFLIS